MGMGRMARLVGADVTVTPDEKAVIDALRQVECAPFVEFSRLCAERDRLVAERDRAVQEANVNADRGDFLVYRSEWEMLHRTINDLRERMEIMRQTIATLERERDAMRERAPG